MRKKGKKRKTNHHVKKCEKNVKIERLTIMSKNAKKNIKRKTNHHVKKCEKNVKKERLNIM